MITFPSTSLVQSVVADAASADFEASAFAVALALVVVGVALWRRSTVAPAVAATSGFGLALTTLAVAVRTGGWATRADAPILGRLVDHRTRMSNEVALVVTTAGGPLETAGLGCVIAALLILRTKRCRPALILLGTVALSAVMCTLLKLLVGRDRPPLSAQLVVETDHSFPSGHVTGTATLLVMTVLALGHLSRTRRVVLLIGALAVTALVAASRLYLGAHWFTDVAGGAVLACVMVTAGAVALRLDAARPERHHRAFPFRPTADDQRHTVSLG
ncbi:phosphatase PAP2 family protein [Rhodococcoides corynebacterioides]|uniref:phosphatase PAP2 family protein n=1 Tax=Rhodococcoides corynebacterioides TaxID=53972 RepID=UPI003F7CFAE9